MIPVKTMKSHYITVTLACYVTEMHEVTHDCYQKCVTAGVCTPTEYQFLDTFPLFGSVAYANFTVGSVTWEQSDQLCQWEGKRLPTSPATGTDEGKRGGFWGHITSIDRVSTREWREPAVITSNGGGLRSLSVLSYVLSPLFNWLWRTGQCVISSEMVNRIK